MAGLCAAARARQLGQTPTVVEKGGRPGGSMLLSSGVVWRYRSLGEFRSACPGGDAGLQRLVLERLDEALVWLEALGAPVSSKQTANPRTLGWRFEPRALTAALVRAAGQIQLGGGVEAGSEAPLEQPVLLATGGFPVRLARERGLLLRSNPWSEGDGIDFARVRGAALTAGLNEFYGRAMPAPPARWGEPDYVRLAQLYGRLARVVDEQGNELQAAREDWSENGLVQEIASRGGTAWYLVRKDELGQPTPYGTIGEAIERVRQAGGTVETRGEGILAVHVAAAVTHTIGGLAIDERARVLDEHGAPVEGLYATGVDAGGISTGGYASGLAAALVLGLVAAEELAG